MKFLRVFLSRFISHKLYSAERGQASVLYALLTPIFLLSIGVTLDLGWYYLNVSRLQNAADSAAVAGAQAIIESKNKNFSDYRYFTLVKGYPGDDYYAYNAPNNSAEEVIYNSNSAAADYASKNLSRQKSWASIGGKYIMTDAWNGSSVSGVTMNPSIYKKDDDIYYVVSLKEKIQHLFLPGWFIAMNAPVTAVAMISKNKVVGDESTDENLTDMPQAVHNKPAPVRDDYDSDVMEEILAVIPRVAGAGAEGGVPEGTNILAEAYKIEDVSVIRNWEWQDWYKRDTVTYSDKVSDSTLKGIKVTPKTDYKNWTGKDIYGGDWAGYGNNVEGRTVRYRIGDRYRSETVTVKPNSGDCVQGDKENPDSLNLDMNPDLNYEFAEDWDIGYPTPEGKTLLSIQNRRSSVDFSKEEYTFRLRIHSTFNFETPYEVRASNKFNTETNPEDVLFVRVESEPIVPLPFVKNQENKHTVFSTVRQIILNINQSNMSSQYRPLMFFYSGPEKIDENSHVRDSQPVVLNLNADARVILFAPNSPVVICGNGHRMQGFVIAKEFVSLTTADDYKKTSDGRYFDKNDSSKEYFKIYDGSGDKSPVMFIDSTGNVQTKPVVADSNNFRDPIYKDDLEKPLRTDVIKYPAYEKVYKMHTAFNIDTSDDSRETSYYDSFQLFDDNPSTGSLKRNIYTYLDAYTDPDKANSVDMFFTKIRSSWID